MNSAFLNPSITLTIRHFNLPLFIASFDLPLFEASFDLSSIILLLYSYISLFSKFFVECAFLDHFAHLNDLLLGYVFESLVDKLSASFALAKEVLFKFGFTILFFICDVKKVIDIFGGVFGLRVLLIFYI